MSIASVAPSLQRIEPDWLTAVLHDAGHPEAVVERVVLEPLEVSGATTDIARLRIGYDRAGIQGPPTLIAKIRGATAVQRQMDEAMGLFAREARFYETFSSELPVRTPGCAYIGDGDDAPLLLEDLGHLRTESQIGGMRIADAEVLMETLADLHARFWNVPDLVQPWLASPATGPFADMIAELVATGAAGLAEKYAHAASGAVLAAIVDAAANWRHVLSRCAEGPQTLVHNDCRLDNLFFADDATPCLIDWQIVARTRGTQDVAYLLAGSMNSDELAAQWRELLARYHERLIARGVNGYSIDECIEHYRVSVLYALGAGMALIGAMDIGDGGALGETIVIRSLRHIGDLDSLGAL